MTGRFLGNLRVELIDGYAWKVFEPFAYQTERGEYVRVPAGFESDFGSIPSWLTPAGFPKSGSYTRACVIHDHLYKTGRIDADATPIGSVSRKVTRGEADSILREAMKACGTSLFVRSTIYMGVRLGGWVGWKRYRGEDA